MSWCLLQSPHAYLWYSVLQTTWSALHNSDSSNFKNATRAVLIRIQWQTRPQPDAAVKIHTYVIGIPPILSEGYEEWLCLISATVWQVYVAGSSVSVAAAWTQHKSRLGGS